MHVPRVGQPYVCIVNTALLTRREYLLPIDVYAVLPPLARLIDERLRYSIVIVAREFVKPRWSVIIIETAVKEGIPEASCEAYKQNSTALASFSLPVCESSMRSVIPFFFGTTLLPSITWTAFNSCKTGQSPSSPQRHTPTHWRKLLHNGNIVQGQLALLTQLHACNTSDHLCAGCDPEDCVRIHVLVAAFALFPGSVFEDKLALLVDGTIHNTSSAVWIFRDIVHLLLQPCNGISLYCRHVCDLGQPLFGGGSIQATGSRFRSFKQQEWVIWEGRAEGPDSRREAAVTYTSHKRRGYASKEGGVL